MHTLLESAINLFKHDVAHFAFAGMRDNNLYIVESEKRRFDFPSSAARRLNEAIICECDRVRSVFGSNKSFPSSRRSVDSPQGTGRLTEELKISYIPYKIDLSLQIYEPCNIRYKVFHFIL